MLHSETETTPLFNTYRITVIAVLFHSLPIFCCQLHTIMLRPRCHYSRPKFWPWPQQVGLSLKHLASTL